MRQRIVSICGSALAGKRCLLEVLGRLTRAGAPHQEERPSGELILSLRISAAQLRRVGVGDASGYDLLLLSTGGHLFYRKDVIRHVLSEAELVLYLFAATEVGPPTDFQMSYYEDYLACAEEVDKHDSAVPWIFVITKVDASVDETRLDDFVRIAGGPLARCSAKTGQGVKELLRLLCSRLSESVER